MCFRCYVISSLFFFLSLFFLSTVQLLQSFCACVCVVPVQADPCTLCAHMVQDLHMNEAFCSERSEFWLRLCFPQNRLRPRTPSSVMQSSSTGNLCVCVRESERNRALKWAPRVRGGGSGKAAVGPPRGHAAIVGLWETPEESSCADVILDVFVASVHLWMKIASRSNLTSPSGSFRLLIVSRNSFVRKKTSRSQADVVEPNHEAWRSKWKLCVNSRRAHRAVPHTRT